MAGMYWRHIPRWAIEEPRIARLPIDARLVWHLLWAVCDEHGRLDCNPNGLPLLLQMEDSSKLAEVTKKESPARRNSADIIEALCELKSRQFIDLGWDERNSTVIGYIRDFTRDCPRSLAKPRYESRHAAYDQSQEVIKGIKDGKSCFRRRKVNGDFEDVPSH
jgi:hypothetical protein